MKEITKLMINVYGLSNFDWLNYKICDINEVTFHHIVKEEDNGKAEISNGALLTKRAHDYLHMIENYDKEIYGEINAILKEINLNGKATELQKERIDLLFLKFECKWASKIAHCEKGSKYNKKKAIAINRRKSDQQGTLKKVKK